MRQARREITEQAQLEAIIHQAEVCRLGFNDGEYPYIVPMNFGYAEGCLYFHSAPEGQKISLLQKDNRVGFELEGIAVVEKHPDIACRWESRFQSVIGRGRASIIDDLAEKQMALDVLMAHYAGKEKKWAYEAGSLAKMVVIKVVIERLWGKQSKHYVRPDSAGG